MQCLTLDVFDGFWSPFIVDSIEFACNVFPLSLCKTGSSSLIGSRAARSLDLSINLNRCNYSCGFALKLLFVGVIL